MARIKLDELSLGKKQKIPKKYSPKLLESFDNPNKNPQWISLICTEFTSLCPKTGQPDFARIFINYIADKKMIESKSLKLYLFGFRNHGAFHEDCIQTICSDLNKLLKPCYLEIIGEFTPRGGIAIYPYSNISNQNKLYKDLKKKRLTQYSPGAYTMKLERIY